MLVALDRRSHGPRARRISLRRTHPNLYRSLMGVALTFIALGFNFLFAHLTFEQFGVPKEAVGAGFLVIGLAQFTFLNLWRSVRWIRVMLIIGIIYMLTWGVGTTETFFTGESSLQLFILYWSLAGAQAPLLLEPFINPVTANGQLDKSS